jgi:hypothetical protein
VVYHGVVHGQRRAVLQRCKVSVLTDRIHAMSTQSAHLVFLTKHGLPQVQHHALQGASLQQNPHSQEWSGRCQ